MHAVDRVELLHGDGEVLVGGMHRQFEQLGDFLAGVSVRSKLQAFAFALRKRRSPAFVGGAAANGGGKQRKATPMNFGKLAGRKGDVGAEKQYQSALAAFAIDGKGDARA